MKETEIKIAPDHSACGTNCSQSESALQEESEVSLAARRERGTGGQEKISLSGKERLVQAVKFVFFSASAGVIQLGSFTLMNEIFKRNYWVCYLIALVLSVVWNFTLNREFTFKSAANVPVAMLKVFAFYAVFTPLSTWGGEAVTDAGVNEYIVVGVTMVLNMVLEFLYCTFLVYKNSMNTKKKRNTVKDGK